MKYLFLFCKNIFSVFIMISFLFGCGNNDNNVETDRPSEEITIEAPAPGQDKNKRNGVTNGTGSKRNGVRSQHLTSCPKKVIVP